MISLRTLSRPVSVSLLILLAVLALSTLFFVKPQTANATLGEGGGQNLFLKIDGMTGDVVGGQHAGEFTAFSFGSSVSTKVNNGGGGGGGGKPTFSDFEVTVKSGKGSPQIFQAAATGMHIKTVTLTTETPNGVKLSWKLSDVLVTAYSSTGSSDDATTKDALVLNFGKIILEYKDNNGANVSAGWDVKQNKKI